MSELPPIKGGGEPWLWPGSVVPVRVDTSRRCSTCQRSVPLIAWRSDRPGDHLIIVREHGGMRFESSASVDGNTIRFRATEDVRLMLCRDLLTVRAPQGESLDLTDWPVHPAQLATERWVAKHDGRSRVPGFLRRLAERLFAS